MTPTAWLPRIKRRGLSANDLLGQRCLSCTCLTCGTGHRRHAGSGGARRERVLGAAVTLHASISQPARDPNNAAPTITGERSLVAPIRFGNRQVASPHGDSSIASRAIGVMLTMSWVCRVPPTWAAVCDSKLVDGSVTVAQVASYPPSATRLALCERDVTRAAIDGAWWPKSLDLRSELPDLLAVFGFWIGAVHRVVYDPSVWLPAPTRLIRHSEMGALSP